jgi:CRISPR system Cascade subunit CasA
MEIMEMFNVIDEPWLPVRQANGSIKEVGLREALTKAYEFQGLADARPLGPPTQLRLLVALAQRIFAPEDATDWKALWQKGHFDTDKIDTYFAKWQDRFDLFHPETPFLQVGGDFTIGNTNPIAKLAHELDPAGYNTLFSHSDAPVVPMTPAESARVLLLGQACALGGGISGNPVWGEKTVVRPNFSHAALATGATLTFEGENLFKTILLNLVPDYKEGDMPVWERDLTVAYFDRTSPDGPLDRLTNLSRMIRLIPETVDGVTKISRCYYTQGRTLSEGQDTMVSYRTDPKLGFQSYKVSAERASWRDLHALLSFSGADGSRDDLRAGVLRFVGDRVAEEFLSLPNSTINLHVAGVAADKAKVLLWRSDAVNLPATFLSDEKRVVELMGCMEDAKEVASEVGRRTRSLCWHFLAPVKDQMAPDTKDVNALADQLDARQGYWAGLEMGFPELLKRLAQMPDIEPTTVALVSDWWLQECRKQAKKSLEASQKRLGETPRAWRALASSSANFTAFTPSDTSKTKAEGKKK